MKSNQCWWNKYSTGFKSVPQMLSLAVNTYWINLKIRWKVPITITSTVGFEHSAMYPSINHRSSLGSVTEDAETTLL
jgi:hypothetical protein